MPTFVYIDEAADYFDRNIEMILREARKYKVGMILAHQYLGQLDTKLQDAFAANTAIKFAGGVSSKDAGTLGRQMNAEPAMLERQPKLSFAAFMRGSGQNTASLAIPYGVVEGMDLMTKEEAGILRDRMRELYSSRLENSKKEAPSETKPDQTATDETETTEPELQSDSSAKKSSPDNPDTPDTGPTEKF